MPFTQVSFTYREIGNRKMNIQNEKSINIIHLKTIISVSFDRNKIAHT